MFSTRILNRRMPVLATLVFLSCAARPATSQTLSHELAAGDRVRVSAPSQSAGIIVGTVRRLEPDRLVLSLSDTDSLALAPQQINSLSIQRRKAATGSGARIGMFTGALASGLLAGATYEPCRPDAFLCIDPVGSRGGAFAIGAVIGLIPGMVAGAVIGSFVKETTWDRVDLDLALTPATSSFDGPTQTRLRPSFRLVIPLGR